MVRLAGFAAINDEQASRPAEPVGETVEAQESRLANQYQRALLHVQQGEARAAEVFQRIWRNTCDLKPFETYIFLKYVTCSGRPEAAAQRRAHRESLSWFVSFPPAAQARCPSKPWWPACRK